MHVHTPQTDSHYTAHPFVTLRARWWIAVHLLMSVICFLTMFAFVPLTKREACKQSYIEGRWQMHFRYTEDGYTVTESVIEILFIKQ